MPWEAHRTQPALPLEMLREAHRIQLAPGL